MKSASDIRSIDGYEYNGCAQFHERLRTAMKKRDMNIRMVAEYCHLDKGTVSSYTRGRTIPNIDIGYRIAYALKVNPMWLFGYTQKG